MVDDYWYFGFAADPIVVHANRWYCISNTKLEGLAVDCVIAMVRIAPVLVSEIK